ncbi:MAG: amidohydrolase family protein [Pseudomonadota bacterium]|nr:amidohydrolase family protein [Pseudomonadota bacterium]
METYTPDVHIDCNKGLSKMMVQKLTNMITTPALIILCVLFSGPLLAAELQPFADTHLHYNVDQAEITETADALRVLIENNVVFGIVSSRPPALALELAEASGGWVIPFFMPYLEPERKIDWVFDKRVLPAARAALASGQYKGLGEMHLISGYTPSLKDRNEIIDGILDLAEEFDVPALIHAEASSHLYFLPLCQRHPRARIVWVHAGSRLRPASVSKLMRACPNVWADLSARDHMRYGKTNPIVDDNGELLPEWNNLVMEFQDRIMLGSDPYYYEGIATWDSANTGWDYTSEVLAFHRRWLEAVPDDVRKKLMLDNAVEFYRLSTKDLRKN